MDWHLVITKEMRALGLQGNDLLVYATINGFSQNGQGCYFGSLAYLAEVCGVSRDTARRALRRLVEAGLIERCASSNLGVTSVTYRVVANCNTPYANCNTPYANCSTPYANCKEGGSKMQPNNKIDNKVGDINISSLSKKRGGFVKPSFFEVQQYIAQRGSVVDAEAFYAYYESNGWKVGRNPMRDWKQAVITWERRERPTPTPPRKESWAERQRRNLEKISAMYAGEGDVQ